MGISWEELENDAEKQKNSGWWKPKAGEFKLVRVLGTTKVNPKFGDCFEGEDLLHDDALIQFPMDGYLKKDDRVVPGKMYYIKCQVETPQEDGKVWRTYYIKELSEEDVQALVTDKKIPF